MADQSFDSSIPEDAATDPATTQEIDTFQLFGELDDEAGPPAFGGEPHEIVSPAAIFYEAPPDDSAPLEAPPAPPGEPGTAASPSGVGPPGTGRDAPPAHPGAVGDTTAGPPPAGTSDIASSQSPIPPGQPGSDQPPLPPGVEGGTSGTPWGDGLPGMNAHVVAEPEAAGDPTNGDPASVAVAGDGGVPLSTAEALITEVLPDFDRTELGARLAAVTDEDGTIPMSVLLEMVRDNSAGATLIECGTVAELAGQADEVRAIGEIDGDLLSLLLVDVEMDTIVFTDSAGELYDAPLDGVEAKLTGGLPPGAADAPTAPGASGDRTGRGQRGLGVEGASLPPSRGMSGLDGADRLPGAEPSSVPDLPALGTPAVAGADDRSDGVNIGKALALGGTALLPFVLGGGMLVRRLGGR